MIGPFALACLDMAGTTVRDDGAVDAAFAAALAAVGIAPGSSRVRARPRRSCATPWGGPRPTSSPSSSRQPTAERATAEFAAAYEAIVAAGAVAEVPGALEVLRTLRERGVKVCLTTGFAPSTRDALVDALGWWQRDRPGPLAGRRGPGPPCARPGPRARWRAWGSAEPRAVAVVGDTVSDLEAGSAARAGAVVGVLSGAHDEATLEAAPHTAIIADVNGLLDVLEPPDVDA